MRAVLNSRRFWLVLIFEFPGFPRPAKSWSPLPWCAATGTACCLRCDSEVQLGRGLHSIVVDPFECVCLDQPIFRFLKGCGGCAWGF